MKKYLAPAGLYLGFFLASFLLCLYLTFDASVLASFLQDGARQGRVRLTYNQASLHGLLGLELTGVELSPLAAPEAQPFAIRKLTLSPNLSSLPGLISDLRQKKNPRLAFDFSLWLSDKDQRNVQGRVKVSPPALLVGLTVANVALDKLPLQAYSPGFPPIAGNMNARLLLDVKDLNRTDTWDGNLQAEIFQGRVDDFQVAGTQVPGFQIGEGNLQIEIKAGKGDIKSFKLQGGEFPINLQGTIGLAPGPFRLGQATVELNGTVQMSDAYKQKMPLLAALIPANNQYRYQGALNGIIPMLK